MLLADMDFVTIKGDRGGDAKEGRTDSFIHRKFTMLRMLVSYGKLIKAEGARGSARHTVRRCASGRPPSGHRRPRGNRSTPSQRARRAGQRHFAVGCALTFEMSLRAVDVRGQWLPTDERGRDRSQRATLAGRAHTGLLRTGLLVLLQGHLQDREDDARSDRVLPALAPRCAAA